MENVEPIDPLGPCDSYNGKLAGNFPCLECGWLYSEHKQDSDEDVEVEGSAI